MSILPPPNAPFYGPFLNACDSFPVHDFLDESMRIERAFNDLCAGVPLAQLERTTIIAAQPAPFPMLAIQQATNTAVILHAIGTFFPPLGYRDDTHIAAGTTIAFIGEAMSQGTLPHLSPYQQLPLPMPAAGPQHQMMPLPLPPATPTPCFLQMTITTST